MIAPAPMPSLFVCLGRTRRSCLVRLKALRMPRSIHRAAKEIGNLHTYTVP